jgi:tailfiber like protein
MAKELNNLEKALSAIAKNTKAAKDTAAEAKKLAAIEPTVTEAGELQYGGKPITKLITTSNITREVGIALGGSDVANSLYKQQSNFEELQVKEASRIALEQGVYYIEDALPEDLKEKVRTRHYEKEKNINQAEALKIVQLIQAWLDKLPSNVWISTRGGVFPLTKNVGYAPDYFGADNRIKTRGVGYGWKEVDGIRKRIPDEVRLTLHGCQPCLAFRKFKLNTIDFTKGTFIVEEHGQDAFHLCDGSYGTRIIHAGNITTRAYLKYGYKSGADLDKMLWPPIDGWSKENPHLGTGMAEKGVAEAGFNTTTYPIVDNACYMNNSLICEGIKNFDNWFSKEQVIQYLRDEDGSRYLSAGGYWDENGVSRFPQDDGTTALTWGKWRGGQIGSRGYGWRIYGTNRTHIEYFDVRGFNGGGIVCGLYGAPDGEQVDARDSKAAYDAGIVAVNTKITGGYFTHNYICGVEAIRASGYELCGIYCPDSVVGHPDAHLEHVRGIGGTTSLAPGYQQCTSRYLPLDNIFIHDNVFGLGKRKIMDIHTGNNVKLINNSGRAMYYGVSTVIEELFASQLINPRDPRNSKDTADPYSFPYQDSNIEVRGNVIVSGLFGMHPINGASGVKFRKDAGKWWLRCHQVWADNIVYAPRGLICNFGHNHFVIDNNQFTFALPFGTFYGLNQISGIKVTNGGSGYTSPPKVKITGGGDGAYDAMARAKIKDGKVTDIIVERVGSRYMVPPTVTIEGGGSGATAEAYVNTFTYGMLVGAETRHGTMLGSVITRNYVQNSPEGNFARQITVGNLRGATIACNYADVTPYSSVEKAKKPFGDPYVSNSMKYRDGIGSFGFYGGALDKCEVFGNYEYDQLTDRLDVWTGSSLRGDRVVSVHSNYAPTTQQDFLDAIKQKSFEMQLEALKKEMAAMKAAGTVTPSPTNPPQSDSGSQGNQPANSGTSQGGASAAQPTTPAPATPAAPAPAAKPETSIKFTFDGVEATATEAVGSNGTSKLKTLNNSIQSGEPDEWAGAFGEVDGHKVMFASARGENKGNRYIESEGIGSDGSSDSAIIVPFKATSADLKSGAFGALVLNGRNIVNTGLVMTNGTDGFTLRVVDGTTVDGKPIVANKSYEFNKWHVAVIPVLAGSERAFDKIRFGMNHAGNAGRSITIGAGFEILQGDISKAAEKAATLMTEYGIATS